MTKIAVILAGSGYLDGSEIRESVLTLTELSKVNAEVTIFAPDIPQRDVVNHITGEAASGESRNVLVESARIARGEISDLSDARAEEFDAVIIPGGFGVAKNLSNLVTDGKNMTILPEFKKLLLSFLEQEKPIGAICISPAVLVAALQKKVSVKVTIGSDEDSLIESIGGKHEKCDATQIAIDGENKIVSTPAYMLDAPLGKISEGIEKLVKEIVKLVG